VDKNHVVSRSDIEQILREYSPLTGATIGRRTSTIVSWFKWIRNNVGIVEVHLDGSVRLSSQLTLNLE